MPLTLEDLRRMVTDVVREENARLEVVAAVTEAGGSAYAEVLITGADDCNGYACGLG